VNTFDEIMSRLSDADKVMAVLFPEDKIEGYTAWGIGLT